MSKKNLVLGGALVVLIALALLYEGPWQNLKERFSKVENFLADLDTTQISRIELKQADELTVLEKEGERWKIAGTHEFYVKDDIMNALVGALNSAAEAEVEEVSTNPENKKDFQTDDLNGTRVKLMRAEELLKELVVGKLSQDFSSTYISPIDSDITYEVGANLNNALVREDWYDMEIFSVERDKLSMLRFQYPTREFTIQTDNEDWIGVLPYRFTIDQEKMDPLLNLMSGLRATEIPVQDFAGTGLEKNLIIIQATGEDIDHILMIGDPMITEEPMLDEGVEVIVEGEEEISDELILYYAKRGDSDNIYLITEEQKETLDISIRDLQQ